MDLIDRKAAIDALKAMAVPLYKDLACEDIWERDRTLDNAIDAMRGLPSAQPEEVIPHRNYKYLSDYWCECGWHLGKKGEVKYCADCGRKVNWDG